MRTKVSLTREVDPGWTWDDGYPFAQAVRAGDFLFLTGQVAIDPQGQIVGVGDVVAQARQIFENIKCILEKAGATFANVVRLTNYFASGVTTPEAYWAVRREYFGEWRPASTGVQVAALAHADLLLEIDVIAYVPQAPDQGAERRSLS
jgi:enamine deaminase RidA (YjgF/YER057c/UK114 family)